jgi:hypothetical protein
VGCFDVIVLSLLRLDFEPGHFTNNKHATVPWLKISEAFSDYIDSSFWPEDVEFKEPTKFKKAEVLRLLSFWLNRQRE